MAKKPSRPKLSRSPVDDEGKKFLKELEFRPQWRVPRNNIRGRKPAPGQSDLFGDDDQQAGESTHKEP
jgi:hypothetical protein